MLVFHTVHITFGRNGREEEEEEKKEEEGRIGGWQKGEDKGRKGKDILF